MAGDTDTADKTEGATLRHLQQAREAGRVAMSREAAIFASLTGAGIALMTETKNGSHVFLDLRAFLEHAGDSDLASGAGFRAALDALWAACMPVLLAAAAAGSAAVLLQTNFLLHGGALQPDFARISPGAGLKRVFGASGWLELLKSLLKLAIFAAAIWIAIGRMLPDLLLLPYRAPSGLAEAAGTALFRIGLACVVGQALIAGVDIALVRFRHARGLRMSKQDIRDEYKEMEGNPHTKARIRRIRMTRARKRMMAAVPTATVVVTNPTHYAVALVYDRIKNPAPRVVAKGVDEVAARIREVAQAANVPLVANPPLARALYQLDLDAEIPAEHYKAVAEIIAYVWRLSQRWQAGP